MAENKDKDKDKGNAVNGNKSAGYRDYQKLNKQGDTQNATLNKISSGINLINGNLIRIFDEQKKNSKKGLTAGSNNFSNNVNTEKRSNSGATLKLLTRLVNNSNKDSRKSPKVIKTKKDTYRTDDKDPMSKNIKVLKSIREVLKEKKESGGGGIVGTVLGVMATMAGAALQMYLLYRKGAFLWKAGKNMFNMFTKGGLFGSGGAFHNGAVSIKNFFTKSIPKAFESLKDLPNTLKESVKNNATRLSEYTKDTVAKYSRYGRNAIDGIKDFFSQKGSVSKLFDKAKSLVSKGVVKAGEFLGKTAPKYALNMLKQVTKGGVKGIVKKLPFVGTAITGALNAKEEYEESGSVKRAAAVGTGSAGGALAGGIVGGKTGAAAGAAVGSLFFGVGAVPGAVIGGFLGAIGGAILGEMAGNKATKAILGPSTNKKNAKITADNLVAEGGERGFMRKAFDSVTFGLFESKPNTPTASSGAAASPAGSSMSGQFGDAWAMFGPNQEDQTGLWTANGERFELGRSSSLTAKKGVDLSNLNFGPKHDEVDGLVLDAFGKHLGKNYAPIITSARRTVGSNAVLGESVSNSRHLTGQAMDLRSNDIEQGTSDAIKRTLATSLGTDFDVIQHGDGANRHIHLEYDPKGYTDGGIVPGSSMTGDKVNARVNSGEMVLNRSQQNKLFQIANGGSVNQKIPRIDLAGNDSKSAKEMMVFLEGKFATVLSTAIAAATEAAVGKRPKVNNASAMPAVDIT
mgnify:CR=1 FL=1